MRIRVDLRDHWEKADSPAQESIAALSEVLGLPVDVTLEAPMLWSELGKQFPNQEIFVPNVVGVVKSWAQCLTSTLDYDANEARVEQFLETCGSRLKAIVVAARKAGTHPMET